MNFGFLFIILVRRATAPPSKKTKNDPKGSFWRA